MADVTLLGARMARDLIFGVGGIDSARVLNFAMRDGGTPQQVLQMAAAAVGAANEALSQRWGAVTNFVTIDHVRYRAGTGETRKTAKKVEGVVDDARRGRLSGHMLPLGDYHDGSLQWTEEYLRDAYMDQIEADIQEVVDAWWNRFDTDVITRMLTSTENAQGNGWDVGWAIGTGTNVNYIPPPWQSETFASSHTHYKYKAGTDASTAKLLIDEMVADLRHHGLSGRLLMLVSESDVEKWAGMNGFVQWQPSGFTFVSTTNLTGNIQVATGETQGVPGEIFGHYNSLRGVVEMRYYERIPAGYCFLTKSYGSNQPNNGIAIRLHPNVPFGLTPDPMITQSLQPKLKGIDLKATYGAGIYKRLNGVAGYFASGISAYANPTIS